MRTAGGSNLRLDLLLLGGRFFFRLCLFYRFARNLLAGSRGRFSARLDGRGCLFAFACSGARLFNRGAFHDYRLVLLGRCGGGSFGGFTGQALGFALTTTHFARVVRGTAGGIGRNCFRCRSDFLGYCRSRFLGGFDDRLGLCSRIDSGGFDGNLYITHFILLFMRV